MSTNADNFSVGPETPKIIGFPSRFVDFPKGVKYWDLRRVQSHFSVISLMCCSLCVLYHRYGKRPQQFSMFVYVV